jgi:hypothetical protein
MVAAAIPPIAREAGAPMYRRREKASRGMGGLCSATSTGLRLSRRRTAAADHEVDEFAAKFNA